MNFNSNFLNKRLPSFFGLIVFAVSIATISWLSGNTILFGTKAAVGNIPRNVQISNISDTSFTLSYTTDEMVLGTLAYGRDKKLGGVALDDRDQIAGKPFPHRVHHITVQQLSPSTAYYFSIASEDQTFSKENNPYQVTTAPPAQDKPTSQSPLSGKAALDDGSIPAEAISYVKTSTSQLLSSLLKPDGSYLIPLNTMRQNDFSSYIAFSPDTKLEIQIASPTSSSNLSTLVEHVNPVPLIILSKNYDFSLKANVASESATASTSANPGLPLGEDTTIVTSPQITSPKEDQAFKDQQPSFTGKAIPDADVEIAISTDTLITTTVKSDKYGNWSFRPSAPLSPGNNSITIKSPDASGIMQTVTNSFTVFAEGSQFIEPSIAAGGGNLTPTIQPTIQPTVQPTAMATPTQILTPTSGNPTIDPLLLTTTPSNNQGGPTSPPIPRSGNEVATMSIFASVIALMVSGILFALL